MISLKQITYALAVERTLHFKKAAESCHISQSALSTALAEMERQLGFQVFERDNKKVLITPLGRKALDKAGQIKLQMDDLLHMAHECKAPLSYPLTLGVIPTIGPYLLPKVLPAVRKRYPDFQLRLVEEQSQVLIDKLRYGDIDAAIIALPFDTSGLHLFEFWEEDFYLIAHRSDSFDQGDEVRGDELRHSRLMLLKEGHCLKDHALAVCKLRPDETDATFAATSLHTLIEMTAGRMGTTLVPAMALEQLLSGRPELKAVRLGEPSPHRRIAFVVRLSYARVDDIDLLRRLFRDQLESKRQEPPVDSGPSETSAGGGQRDSP